MSVVLDILIAPKQRAPMESQDQVYVSLRGIQGDHHEKTGKPDGKRHVTFFSLQDLQEGNAKREHNNKEPFCPEETRRNIFLDIPQEQLVNLQNGHRFQIGEVIFEATTICSPCTTPSDLAGKPGFNEDFEGGLCARVIRPGFIKKGDPFKALS